jgi:hypothetical protein
MPIRNFIPAIDLITDVEFKRIIAFIIEKGDRKFYCNRFNNNPHYRLSQCDIYLNPSDVRNIECDSLISDFNEIVFYNSSAVHQYYYMRIESVSNEVVVNMKDVVLRIYLKEITERMLY